MTYRVEYAGGGDEIPTLNAAIEMAKRAIDADVGPVEAYAVEHDDTINDWFVQGLVGGSPVGSMAVVSGPEPTVTPDTVPDRFVPAAPAGGDDGWMRSVTFDGGTPAEVFSKATAWLAGRPEAVSVQDVGWQPAGRGRGTFQLRLHYRAAP